MNITHPPFTHQDDRGAILDVLTHEPVDAATLVTCNPYSVRGQHYHKLTTQWLYVLRGTIMTETITPGGEVARVTCVQGDLIRHDAGERHTVRALEPAMLLVLTRGPRNGEDYESDTYR